LITELSSKLHQLAEMHNEEIDLNVDKLGDPMERKKLEL